MTRLKGPFTSTPSTMSLPYMHLHPLNQVAVATAVGSAGSLLGSIHLGIRRRGYFFSIFSKGESAVELCM